jgi:hypothetical protein
MDLSFSGCKKLKKMDTKFENEAKMNFLRQFFVQRPLLFFFSYRSVKEQSQPKSLSC